MPFHTRADSTLEALYDAAEKTLSDTHTIELEQGILTIEEASGRQYLINKHAPTEQLWLSSPHSGAWHFAWKNDVWTNTRGAESLAIVLKNELGIVL